MNNKTHTHTQTQHKGQFRRDVMIGGNGVVVVGEVLFYVFLPLKFTEEVETSTLFLIPENAQGEVVTSSNSALSHGVYKC